ncbi:MAG: exostosin family protein [Solirubrobacteraceae bacterium]
MEVWLASVSPDGSSPAVASFEQLARDARSTRHKLADSPERADLILFVDAHLFPRDPGQRALLTRQTLLDAHRSKCLVYDERDDPWLTWPGLYVSMPARAFVPEYQAAWGYYATPAASAEAGPEPDLLFSFVGSPSHRARRGVYSLRDARAVVERIDGFTFYDESSVDFEQRRKHYRDVLLRSKFVLCPRGKGTSSIRLYETLAAGRVPVIIADEWVAPRGPDWESFALRWPEHDVAALPRVLAEREDDYERMAAATRNAFASWFAPERAWDRLIDACQPLLERDAPTRFPRRGIRGRRYLEVRVRRARDVAIPRARGAARQLLRRLGRRPA